MIHNYVSLSINKNGDIEAGGSTMRINFNGIIGLFAIGAMIFLIVSRQGDVNWVYIIATSFIYLTLLLANSDTGNFLTGAHIYFALVVLSLLFSDVLLARYSQIQEARLLDENLYQWATYTLLFLACFTFGITCPILIVSGYSVLAIPLSIGIVISALLKLNFFTFSELLPMHYALAAVVLCAGGAAIVVVDNKPGSDERAALGFCVALLFLTIGLWVNLENVMNYVFFITASFVLGMAVPFLLLRKGS
jgi:hypothetical protein